MHWRLSDCQTAAFDRETVRCTLTIVYCENPLIRRFSRWNAESVAPDSGRSNALTRLFMMSDGCTQCWCIRCTDEIVWLSDCCIWPWNGQMHADDCLLTRTRWCWLCVESMMLEKLHLTLNDQMHWRNCLMSKRLHSISNDRMHWRFSICDSIKMPIRCIWSIFFVDLITELDKTKWVDLYKMF